MSQRKKIVRTPTQTKVVDGASRLPGLVNDFMKAGSDYEHFGKIPPNYPWRLFGEPVLGIKNRELAVDRDAFKVILVPHSLRRLAAAATLLSLRVEAFALLKGIANEGESPATSDRS